MIKEPALIMHDFLCTCRYVINTMQTSKRNILIVGRNLSHLVKRYRDQPRFTFWDVKHEKIGRRNRLPANVGVICLEKSLDHTWTYRIDALAGPNVYIMRYGLKQGILRVLLDAIDYALREP